MSVVAIGAGIGSALSGLFGRKKREPYGQKEARRRGLEWSGRYAMSPEGMMDFSGPDFGTRMGIQSARQDAMNAGEADPGWGAGGSGWVNGRYEGDNQGGIRNCWLR